jgi:hypothetical protein
MDSTAPSEWSGIDAVEMRTRIFDDLVVAALDRPVAGTAMIESA